MPLIFSSHDNQMLPDTIKTCAEQVGGRVVFTGLVRGVNHQKVVSHLQYEAFESLAMRLFSELEEEAQRRFLARNIFAVHRIGRVEVGQVAVMISAEAEHRHEAFLACRFLIDELKRSLPIWRKEIYDDGSFSFEQTGGCLHQQENSSEQKMTPSARALASRGIHIETLQKARILLVGAGGLGCPVAINLQALGVGHITVYDGDVVELSNLARQFIYKDSDVGFYKSYLLQRFIQERNQACRIDSRNEFIDEHKALLAASDHHLIIDATDCMYTKRMLKRVAHAAQIPLVSGSVYQSEGEVGVYQPHAAGPCLGCYEAWGDEHKSCASTGVLAHACGLVAAIMAEKSLAILSKTFPVNAEITLLDAVGGGMRAIKIDKDPYCLLCGTSKVLKNKAPKKLVRFAA